MQQAKIKNIEYKMEYLEIECQENNPGNRIRKMLESLYETSIEELNGKFTQEMNEIICGIRNSFTNLPSESELMENANEKLMKKQLVPVDQIGKKKIERIKLEEENEFIKYQLERKKVKSNNNLKRNAQSSIIGIFNDLNRIEEILKDKDRVNKEEKKLKPNIDCIR